MFHPVVFSSWGQNASGPDLTAVNPIYSTACYNNILNVTGDNKEYCFDFGHFSTSKLSSLKTFFTPIEHSFDFETFFPSKFRSFLLAYFCTLGQGAFATPLFRDKQNFFIIFAI